MGCVWSGEAGSTYRGWMGWDSWSMTMRGHRYRHMYSMCVHSYSMWYFCPSPVWSGSPLILHIKVCLGLWSTTARARCAKYLEWSHLSRPRLGSEDAPWGYISRCEQNIWISYRRLYIELISQMKRRSWTALRSIFLPPAQRRWRKILG